MPIYTYPQLKGKIKVGDTVSAVMDKGNPCDNLADDGSNKQKITEVSETGFKINGCPHTYEYANFSLFIHDDEPKTLDMVDVGDVVVLGKEERMVLDKSPNGTVLFLSATDVFEHSGDIFTRQELFDNGYTVKQGPQPVIMTREEAEKELSKDGKQVKIV